jgi:hypothetical protein
MKKKLSKLKYIILSLVILTAACSDDGDPGPKGDQGEQGEPGTQGEAGAANVIYMPWFTPVWDIKDEPTYKTLRKTEMLLTPEFLEGNIVLVYRKYEHNGVRRIDLLPQLILKADGTISTKLESYVYGNGIYVSVSSYGANISEEYYDGRNSFKYILVPGSQVTGAGERKSTPVDYNDYDAVMAYYHLQD